MIQQTIKLSIKATPGQIKFFKKYTRDLGCKRWKAPLEEVAQEELFTPGEIAEIEKQ